MRRVIQKEQERQTYELHYRYCFIKRKMLNILTSVVTNTECRLCAPLLRVDGEHKADAAEYAEHETERRRGEGEEEHHRDALELVAREHPLQYASST